MPVFGMGRHQGCRQVDADQNANELSFPRALVLHWSTGVTYERSHMRSGAASVYVPQMLSADGELTGRENLLIFAKLYGLGRAQRTSANCRRTRVNGLRRRRGCAGQDVFGRYDSGAAVFRSFSLIVACVVKTRDRFMGIGQVLTMPLFFASNAIYAIGLMPHWLQFVARANPLSYQVDALRAVMIHGSSSAFGLGMDLSVMLAVLIALLAIASRMYPNFCTKWELDSQAEGLVLWSAITPVGAAVDEGARSSPRKKR